jgi:subtilisin family serine protease
VTRFPPLRRVPLGRNRRAQSCRLKLEMLEDRTLLSGVSSLPANVLPITWHGQNASAIAGQWVARFDGLNGAAASQTQVIQSLLDTTHLGLHVVEQMGMNGLVLLQGPAAVTADQVQALASLPGYRYVEPNFYEANALLDTIPNDPSFPLEYGMRNIGQTIQGQVGIAGADISATKAWDITTGSTSVTIADIDTGTDYNHPDLYKNIWINQAEIPQSRLQNLVDVDGDGLITFRDLNNPINQGPGKITDITGHGRIDASDILSPMILDAQGHDTGMGGWAYPGNTQDGDTAHPNDFVGWNFVANNNAPFDDNSHGTHTSGTIAADGNNGIGVAGVNWTVQLMPDKWIAGGGSGTTAAAISAVIYSVNHGARVSSNSWHVFEDSQGLYDAINYARTNGDLFVAAAGNDGHNTDTNPNWPSIYVRTLDNIISVAATDNRDQRAGFSNWGLQTVNLGGPGVDVYSTFPNNSYGYDSGTSMATPHVAGAAALGYSIAPNATYQVVRQAIFDSVDPNTALRTNGPSPVSTGGRLNAFRMLQEFTTAGPVVFASTPSGNSSVPGTVDHVRFSFNVPIDPTTFTIASGQVDSFTDPQGNPIAVTGIAPVDSTNTQFDVSFNPLTLVGAYQMVIGPNILDMSGNPMDQNRNGIPGEVPGDEYTAHFGIQGAKVTASTPTGSGSFPGSVDHVRFTFNEAMDPTTFTPTQVSFTDPQGNPISINSIAPVDSTNTQFDVSFNTLTVPGAYQMVIGPNILDPYGNPMDQNGNLIPGEIPGDQYTAQFSIQGPAVVSTTLTGTFNNQVVDHGRLVFNEPIDPNSFTPNQVSLTDTGGNPVNILSITPDGTNTRFDVTFDPQSALGTYTLTVGPNIIDFFGNPAAVFTSQFTITNELIVNGGFETGTFSGWTQSGNTGATGVGTGTVHSGTYSAFLGPVGSEGFLAQTFATAAGSTYTLSYWLQHDGGSPSSFHAMINGVNIPGSVLNNPPPFGYTQYTFTFTAAGAQTELKFGFQEDPTYFHLDDVSVTRSPAPAPPGGSGSSGTFGGTVPAVGQALAGQAGLPLSLTLGSGGLGGSAAWAILPVASVPYGASAFSLQSSWEAPRAGLVDQVFASLRSKDDEDTFPASTAGSRVNVDSLSLDGLGKADWSL